MTGVYGLKRATNKMKYQHMNFILAWRTGLQEKPDRQTALEQIGALLDGQTFNTWYDQVYALRRAGRQAEYEQAIFTKLAELTNQPLPAPAATLAERAQALINSGKANRMTFQGRELAEIARLLTRLEAQSFWLGKCRNESYISYLAEKPLRRRHGLEFTGAVGPFKTYLGAAYFARMGGAPQEADRLALEDHDSLWPIFREQILVEASMSAEEREAFEADMAGKYNPS
jgi:hypothetical protein